MSGGADKRRVLRPPNSRAQKRAARGRLCARSAAALAALLGLLLACSPRRMAVKTLADTLASAGASVQSDDDPELIRDAAPFNLKLMESVLDEAPRHRGLLLAACRGFTQYAYAFVQQDADEREATDLAAADALRTRARKLYFRARDYGLRGLEAAHPGFAGTLRRAPSSAAAAAGEADVPLLYWTAAAWGSAVALSKDDPDTVADLPLVEALIDRALELDETFDHGAVHVFLIAYEFVRPGGSAGAPARASAHFDRAVELSGGDSAAPFVAVAEAGAVRRQDRALFESLLRRALAIDPDRHPECRLANLVAQRRARWLLSRTGELFVE